jgi:chemotaxis signal transduction protein
MMATGRVMVATEGMTATEATTSFLICRVGSTLLALPVAAVEETMRALPLEPFAGMLEFVLGLAVIRGRATPVIDLSRLLSKCGCHPGRFVVAKAGSRQVALAVETVVGTRTLSARSFQDLPPLLAKDAPAAIDAIATLDTELFLLLESSRLLPEAAWTSLEAAEASP